MPSIQNIKFQRSKHNRGYASIISSPLKASASGYVVGVTEVMAENSFVCGIRGNSLETWDSATMLIRTNTWKNEWQITHLVALNDAH